MLKIKELITKVMPLRINRDTSVFVRSESTRKKEKRIKLKILIPCHFFTATWTEAAHLCYVYTKLLETINTLSYSHFIHLHYFLMFLGAK